MISVNATYNTIIANGGQFEWQIVNGANTFSKANLMSGSISSSLCEGVAIGSTISAQLDISLYDVTVDTTNPLVVQFRATDGTNDSSWYTKGTFYIDTLETSPYTDVTKITAFDSMLMTEYVYQLQGEWQSVTDLVVLNKITGFIGISLESATQTLFSNNPKTLTNAPNIGEDGTTAREVLSYIGALRGGNWRITPDNKLQLIILSASPTNTANVGDAVTDIDAAPAETVKKVRVWTNDTEFYAFPELPLTDHSLNPITTHTLEEICIRASEWAVEWEQLTGRTIDVQIPFWCDYAAAKAIFTQFKDLVFYPYNSSTAFVPPEYEIGDGIVIKTTTSIIASQTIEISPLASSSVELKKDEMINSLYPYKAPFRRKTNYQVSKNASNIAENTAQIAENSAQIALNAQGIAQVPTLIQQQTDLITGGYGGYIKFNKLPDGTPSEMLIMDTPSEDTATDIIRLNRNGIGFSTDGGATYGTAWTIDGTFNADYIQAGTLSADRIAANSIAVSKLTGTIADSGNTWEINLTTGSMTIGNITANKITSGTLNVGNLTVTGTIQDNLSTPKNYWNLNTGDFVTKQGTLGTFTIDADGLSASLSNSILGNIFKTNYSEDGIVFLSTTDSGGNPGRYVSVQGGSITIGATNSAGTDVDQDSIFSIYNQVYLSPIDQSRVTSITNIGSPYSEIVLSRGYGTSYGGIGLSATDISIIATNFTVNNHQVLEIH